MLKVATKFTPEEHALETAKLAGFRFAEFWLDATWLSQWQSVAKRAQQYPLGYALHFPNRGDLTDTTLQEAAHLYQELGCSAMVIHAPMLKRYGDRLLGIDSTLRLGVENHRLTRDAFESWAVENRYLTLDVEHLWKYTLEDPPVDDLVTATKCFLDRFGEKLVHVHLPGYTPGCDEHRPMYCSREMVLPILSLLADYSFDGLIVSEVNPEFQNFHDLRMDVLLIERWQELHRQDEIRKSSCPSEAKS